ncbi:MAG: M12 family metallo-peptidase [Ignavibacteria bacterium]|jgi:hypothetical protein
MKIKYSPFIFIILAVIIGFLGNSFLKNESGENKTVANQKHIKSVKEIIAEKKANSNFENIKLFEFNSADVKSNGLEKYIESCTILKLKKNNLQELINTQKENIVLEIPLTEKTSLNLELTKVTVFSDKFEIKVISENGVEPFIYKPGVYYRGIVKDNPKSSVAVSIFENSVIGVIADETGNNNLGVLSDDKSGESYIYYNDRDLNVKNKFKCRVDDYDLVKKNSSKIQHSDNNSDNPSARLPVRVYFVADYQMYLDKGSSLQNVSNFISGIFNEVATIYQNEYLPVQISSISVYTSPDPYRSLSDPFLILQAFGQNTKDNFTGDLAHLLSTRNEGFGGISWVRSLCASYDPNYYDFGRFSFSGLDNTTIIPPFPTYSWNVTVIAHEMGHSFGSQHTHACVWPVTANSIGQIDSCVNINDESCTGTPVKPINYGTLMSYCHLQGSINLYLGFGSMPGDTVRLRYNQSLCFGSVVNSSELPANFKLDQNYPNPFNPATTISFAVPQDAYITIKVFDIMGREIAEVVNNKFYSRGYQNVLFNSARFNLSSGIYFYKLIASNTNSVNVFSQVKKMLLIK